MNEHPNKPIPPDLLRQLSAAIDGELSPGQAARIQRRLVANPEARRAREEFEALDGMLALWPAPPVADVRGAVMARVRTDLTRRAGRRPRPWHWAAAAWAATWVMGGMLTGLTLWGGIDHRLNEQAAVETMAQDMSLAMIMTEDWTPPIAIEEDAQP